MTRLYLTRHGQTEWNLIGIMQGSKESSLTEKGITQALQLGKRLEKTRLDIVYSSSSQRALSTAKLIVGKRNLPIIEVGDLTELNFGIWEGLKYEEIQSKYAEQYQAFWNTPHLLKDFPGETFDHFKTRVVGAIQRIIAENEGRDVLIVAHAVVLKFLLNHFENIPLEKAFDERIIHPTSLSIVEITSSEHQILTYNDTEHYKGI